MDLNKYILDKVKVQNFLKITWFTLGGKHSSFSEALDYLFNYKDGPRPAEPTVDDLITHFPLIEHYTFFFLSCIEESLKQLGITYIVTFNEKQYRIAQNENEVESNKLFNKFIQDAADMVGLNKKIALNLSKNNNIIKRIHVVQNYNNIIDTFMKVKVLLDSLEQAGVKVNFTGEDNEQ